MVCTLFICRVVHRYKCTASRTSIAGDGQWVSCLTFCMFFAELTCQDQMACWSSLMVFSVLSFCNTGENKKNVLKGDVPEVAISWCLRLFEQTPACPSVTVSPPSFTFSVLHTKDVLLGLWRVKVLAGWLEIQTDCNWFQSYYRLYSDDRTAAWTSTGTGLSTSTALVTSMASSG